MLRNLALKTSRNILYAFKSIHQQMSSVTLHDLCIIRTKHNFSHVCVSENEELAKIYWRCYVGNASFLPVKRTFAMKKFQKYRKLQVCFYIVLKNKLFILNIRIKSKNALKYFKLIFFRFNV